MTPAPPASSAPEPDTRYGVSLFTGAGIGDVGWREAGVEFVAKCEIDLARAAIAAHNFPSARVFARPIEEARDAIIEEVETRTSGSDLFVAVCTPPCQGMSKSGQGTLLANMRAGKRPKLDPRNRLIIPALDILEVIRPRWIVFENVVEMKDTIISDDTGRLVKIVDLISERLSPEYAGAYYEVEFADYGIPQRRQRLISVLTRDERARTAFTEGLPLIPAPTHSATGDLGRQRWVSVVEALQGFPKLDAGDSSTAADPSIPYHRVPTLDAKKHWWIKNTKPGTSAFDNQCANRACGFQGNPTHGTRRGLDGINRALKDTPLHCARCGELLPRPSTVDPDGTLRIMSGFTSAYKRMEPGLPASTLTRNLSYPCSDNKVHPFQHRVLSLAEAFVIHSLADFDFDWKQASIDSEASRVFPRRTTVPDGLIRLTLGESVPPRFFLSLAKHLIALDQRRPALPVLGSVNGTTFRVPSKDLLISPRAEVKDRGNHLIEEQLSLVT